jgi:antitoxin (DNA-binding transcriptional repressor) of toxin-antitoxin stability system
MPRDMTASFNLRRAHLAKLVEEMSEKQRRKNMTQISIEQAENRLLELLEQAAKGEQVVIVRSDGSAFRLVPLPRIPKPIFGSAKGLVQIHDDFDEPLNDFTDYMPSNTPD